MGKLIVNWKLEKSENVDEFMEPWATFTLEDDILVLNQKGMKDGDLDAVITRQVNENEELIEVYKIVQKNVVAVKTSTRYTP